MESLVTTKVSTQTSEREYALTYLLQVELGVILGKTGRDIPATDAESYIAGYGGNPLPHICFRIETDDTQSTRD